jgi:hypothetical protein
VAVYTVCMLMLSSCWPGIYSKYSLKITAMLLVKRRD